MIFSLPSCLCVMYFAFSSVVRILLMVNGWVSSCFVRVDCLISLFSQSSVMVLIARVRCWLLLRNRVVSSFSRSLVRCSIVTACFTLWG